MSLLTKIKELVKYLPKEDISFAETFLSKRDYESLKELTWSSFKRVEKAYIKENIPEKYKNVDIDKLRDLAVTCEEYYFFLYPEELEEDDFDMTFEQADYEP